MRWSLSQLFSVPPEINEEPATSATSAPVTPTLVKKGRARKKAIPVRLREAVWTAHMGKVFEEKCTVTWCTNRITVFDFQCGHDIPESKGGETTIKNLRPICGRCNLSMGNRYSLEEWNRLTPATEVKSVPEAPVPRGFTCC
jgi:5-methylcytosine-specific restriction endonuclease McrA